MQMPERTTPTVDDLKTPLLAAVGAADLALERVNDIVATLRERAEEARSDASTRAHETRGRLTKLQEDLPRRTEELRERFTSEELRKAAESYRETAAERYQDLVERGEAALQRLRSRRSKGAAKKAGGSASAKKAPTKKAAKRTPAKKATKK
jgi:heparin binding hemagglutinin HbhA